MAQPQPASVQGIQFITVQPWNFGGMIPSRAMPSCVLAWRVVGPTVAGKLQPLVFCAPFSALRDAVAFATDKQLYDPQADYISLTNYRIETMPAFGDCPNLQHIVMRQNKLTRIEKVLALGVVELDLYENQITAIENVHHLAQLTYAPVPCDGCRFLGHFIVSDCVLVCPPSDPSTFPSTRFARSITSPVSTSCQIYIWPKTSCKPLRI